MMRGRFEPTDAHTKIDLGNMTFDLDGDETKTLSPFDRPPSGPSKKDDAEHDETGKSLNQGRSAPGPSKNGTEEAQENKSGDRGNVLSVDPRPRLNSPRGASNQDLKAASPATGQNLEHDVKTTVKGTTAQPSEPNNPGPDSLNSHASFEGSDHSQYDDDRRESPSRLSQSTPSSSVTTGGKENRVNEGGPNPVFYSSTADACSCSRKI
jgi:hypothetical protein